MKYILVPILFIILILAALNAYEEKEKIIETQKKEIEHQHQQLEIKNEILETKKEIFKRKEISKTISTSDNIEWLRQTRCKDCSS
jgi:hypothetical protein